MTRDRFPPAPGSLTLEPVTSGPFCVLGQVLDRREWKALRQEFSESPELKRCGRRLPRYCDSNNDRKIELDEWLVCVGAVEGEQLGNRGEDSR